MSEETWRYEIERACHRLAANCTGRQVVRAVLLATETCWDAGLDEAYHELTKREGVTEENAEAFHTLWLAIFAVKLHEEGGSE